MKLLKSTTDMCSQTKPPLVVAVSPPVMLEVVQGLGAASRK